MNKELREILSKSALIPNKITLKNNVKIIETDQGRFVFKKHQNKQIDENFRYLKSRSFDYFPSRIINNNKYDIYEYLEDINEPLEQKALDLVRLLALLHAKTTFYKEVDLEDYKEIYEKINDQINQVDQYYQRLIELIDNEIYMSPGGYLIARNISKVFESIIYAKENLEKWYEIAGKKRKIRVVKIHNNIDLNHYIKADKPYLISWEKSKIDIPIYDLYQLYQKHYLDIDFSELLSEYESKYPLLEEERILLQVLLIIPKQITYHKSQYVFCQNTRKAFDYLYKTKALISEYRVTKTP